MIAGVKKFGDGQESLFCGTEDWNALAAVEILDCTEGLARRDSIVRRMLVGAREGRQHPDILAFRPVVKASDHNKPTRIGGESSCQDAARIELARDEFRPAGLR